MFDKVISYIDNKFIDINIKQIYRKIEYELK